MSTTRTITRFACPFLAAAVLIAGIAGASQPADAKLSRGVKTGLVVGAVLGTALVVGAASSRAQERACTREWVCRGDVCRRVMVCD